jgi:putative DNA primase/helicase
MNEMSYNRYTPSDLAQVLGESAPHKQRRVIGMQGHLGKNELRIDNVTDFLALEFPPRDHLLSPWLPTQGLAMVYAPRGVGKTFFALGVAYAVACAGDFLGWKAPQARGVLLIDGEMPAAVLQERIANIVASTDTEPAAPLKLITPDRQPKRMLDLTDTDDQAALSSHLDGVDLIIVDNISTLCRTGRENEAEGWLPVQQWALQQRAAGRSVLFVHHAGKGGAQRGASRREDILDTVIALKRPPDYSPESGACFEVHFEKSRGFYGEDSKPFEASLTTYLNGRQIWATRGLEDSTFDRVVGLHQEGLSPKEISIELGIHRSQVSRHLKRARAEGRISSEDRK